MSTLVSYLLAAILQFMGASTPKTQEPVSVLKHQQCEEIKSQQPYILFTNKRESKQTIR